MELLGSAPSTVFSRHKSGKPGLMQAQPGGRLRIRCSSAANPRPHPPSVDSKMPPPNIQITLSHPHTTQQTLTYSDRRRFCAGTDRSWVVSNMLYMAHLPSGTFAGAGAEKAVPVQRYVRIGLLF